MDIIKAAIDYTGNLCGNFLCCKVKADRNELCITELNASYEPSLKEKEDIDIRLNALEKPMGISERKKLTREIIKMVNSMYWELYGLRNDVFEFREEGTLDVHVLLAKNQTIHERDHYIRKLYIYYYVIDALDKLEVRRNIPYGTLHTAVFPNKQKSAMKYLDLGDDEMNPVTLDDNISLQGDLCSMADMIYGKPAMIPDLTYIHNTSVPTATG